MHASVQETILSDHMIYEIHLMTPEEHRRYPHWMEIQQPIIGRERIWRQKSTQS